MVRGGLVAVTVVSSMVLAIACGRALDEGTSSPAPGPDAAADPDAGPADANVAFDAGDPEPVDVDGNEPPPLDDAGCADAAFSESFGWDGGFDARWSKTMTGNGIVELDGTYVSPPSSLRARIDTTASGKAYVARSVCPSSGTILCRFSLRIDQSTEGDIGILDLRGTRMNGTYGVARVKARELMFLSPEPDGGQRVDRSPVPLVARTTGAFHTVEIAVTATTYTIKVDGALEGTLPVPAAGLSIDEVRAGVVYASGTRSPGWDIRLDELDCRYE